MLRYINGLLLNVQTITEQPHVSSKAQSILAITDFNVYSWFNVISPYISLFKVVIFDEL